MYIGCVILVEVIDRGLVDGSGGYGDNGAYIKE